VFVQTSLSKLALFKLIESTEKLLVSRINYSDERIIGNKATTS
jgi:hypothetical protein